VVKAFSADGEIGKSFSFAPGRLGSSAHSSMKLAAVVGIGFPFDKQKTTFAAPSLLCLDFAGARVDSWSCRTLAADFGVRCALDRERIEEIYCSSLTGHIRLLSVWTL
jgi:hypothetical protein